MINMRLRSGSSSKYNDESFLVNELIYLMDSIDQEKKIAERITLMSGLFNLLITNKSFVLNDQTLSKLIKIKLIEFSNIDNVVSKWNNDWLGSKHYYRCLFNQSI